jgi:hypothetical protein
MVVALQPPSDLDTVYTLALLQEEMADSNKRSEFHTHDHGASFKSAMRMAVPTTRPLPIAAVAGDKPLAKATAPDTDDKLSKLHSYRRARGLYDVCAEKWFHGHKCATTISLQAMQEVWNLFQLEEVPDNTEEEQDSPVDQPEHLFLALSSDALRGTQGRQTIQFHGKVQGLPVTVLIDSGNSASFLAASVAEQLPQLLRTLLTASVKVANGHLLQCTAAVFGCCFSLGDY